VSLSRESRRVRSRACRRVLGTRRRQRERHIGDGRRRVAAADRTAARAHDRCKGRAAPARRDLQVPRVRHYTQPNIGRGVTQQL